MKLLIHAPNVHQGGGRTLLLALLHAQNPGVEISAVVDDRLQVTPQTSGGRILLRVRPTIRGRLAAEWRLRSLVAAGDVLLCFGNLPPLFGSRGRVVLFLQNRYLIDHEGPRNVGGWTRLRIQLEQLWLRGRLAAVHRIVVQTPSMARAVRQTLGVDALVLPFVAAVPGSVHGSSHRPPGNDGAEFLYVSSGEAHKNHRNLLDAWTLLAQQGIYPTLSITLDATKHAALCAHIEAERSTNRFDVRNLGTMNPSQLSEAYRRCTALIYPSVFESFGIPLLEAQAHGVPILAAERDYVRDVVDPVETFDPESPLSIARSVKRFLGLAEDRVSLKSADQFISTLTDQRTMES